MKVIDIQIHQDREHMVGLVMKTMVESEFNTNMSFASMRILLRDMFTCDRNTFALYAQGFGVTVRWTEDDQGY